MTSQILKPAATRRPALQRIARRTLIVLAAVVMLPVVGLVCALTAWRRWTLPVLGLLGLGFGGYQLYLRLQLLGLSPPLAIPLVLLGLGISVALLGILAFRYGRLNPAAGPTLRKQPEYLGSHE